MLISSQGGLSCHSWPILHNLNSFQLITTTGEHTSELKWPGCTQWANAKNLLKAGGIIYFYTAGITIMLLTFSIISLMPSSSSFTGSFLYWKSYKVTSAIHCSDGIRRWNQNCSSANPVVQCSSSPLSSSDSLLNVPSIVRDFIPLFHPHHSSI